MIPDLRWIEWAAIGGTAITVLLLGGGGFLAAQLEAFGGKRFNRESDRLEADEQQRKLMAALNEAAKATAEPGEVPAPIKPSRRWSVGELVTRAAYWLAVKALRLDRQEASK